MPSPDFRSQLDSILRNKNPEAVRQFLVAQGQWPENVADVERAMWLMIVGSPALRELHHEAYDWLISHGSQAEAEMLLERTKAPQKPTAPPSPKAGASPQKSNGGKRRSNTGSPKPPSVKPGPDRSSHPPSRPPK